MSASNERDQALSVLGSNLKKISKLYKECYLSKGRGALLLYAQDVIRVGMPNDKQYRIKEELLDVFDSPDSQAEIVEMVDGYNPQKEGIMTLITSHSNATFFITVNLK